MLREWIYQDYYYAGLTAEGKEHMMSHVGESTSPIEILLTPHLSSWFITIKACIEADVECRSLRGDAAAICDVSRGRFAHYIQMAS